MCLFKLPLAPDIQDRSSALAGKFEEFFNISRLNLHLAKLMIEG